jgi:hypothetical protein
MSENEKRKAGTTADDASVASSLFVANEAKSEALLTPVKDQNANDLDEASRTISGNPQGHGFYAEVHHTTTHRINGFDTDDSIEVTRLGSNEFASPDILSSTGDPYNLKFYATPSDTFRAISKPEYDGQIGVVPSDQLQEVLAIRDERISAALESGDIDLADRLAHLQVTDHVGQSEPLSYSEARDGADSIRNGDVPEWADSYGIDDLGERSLEAAGLSLVVDLGPQVASDVYAILRGETSIGDASGRLLANVKRRGGKAALTSGAKAAASGGLVYFEDLDPTGATLFVTLSFEVGKHAFAYKNGEITLEEFKRLSTKSIVDKGSSVLLTSAAVTLFGPVGLITPFIIGKLTSDAKQRQQMAEALKGCFDEAETLIQRQVGILSRSQVILTLAADTVGQTGQTIVSSERAEQSIARAADGLTKIIADQEAEQKRIADRRERRNGRESAR